MERYFTLTSSILLFIFILSSCELFQLQPGLRDNPKDPSSRDRRWSDPVEISTNVTGYAYDQNIASDGNGNAVAVWTVDLLGNENTRVWASRYINDSGWTTAEQLDETSLESSSNPSIAHIGSGNFIAVWEQSDGTYSYVYYRVYDMDDGWGNAVILSGEDSYSYEPEIAFSKSGNGFAVWELYDDMNDNYDVWGCRYISGNGWETPEAVGYNSDEDERRPQVACNNTGSAVMAWEQYDGTSFSVYGSYCTATETWHYPKDLSSGWDRTQRKPFVDMGDSGYGLAIWFEINPNTNYCNVYALSCDTLTGWKDTAELITANGEETCDYLPSCVQFNDDGMAMACWTQDPDPDSFFHFWANTYSAADGWSDETRIEYEKDAHAVLPSIRFDESGNCLAVWYYISPNDFSCWSNLYIPDTGWGSPEIISESPDVTAEIGQYLPGLAVDANGDAFAVWLEYENTRTNIMAALYR